MLVPFALALLFLVLWTRREGFSVTVKADGGMVKALDRGARWFVKDATARAYALPEAAMSMVPFRSTFRQWHRNIFKNNIPVLDLTLLRLFRVLYIDRRFEDLYHLFCICNK